MNRLVLKKGQMNLKMNLKNIISPWIHNFGTILLIYIFIYFLNKCWLEFHKCDNEADVRDQVKSKHLLNFFSSTSLSVGACASVCTLFCTVTLYPCVDSAFALVAAIHKRPCTFHMWDCKCLCVLVHMDTRLRISSCVCVCVRVFMPECDMYRGVM